MLDADNNLEKPDTPEYEVQWAGDILNATQVGDMFGSAIGTLIGSKNVFANIAINTVVGTLAENVYEAVRNWSGDVSYVEGQQVAAAMAVT